MKKQKIIKLNKQQAATLGLTSIKEKKLEEYLNSLNLFAFKRNFQVRLNSEATHIEYVTLDSNEVIISNDVKSIIATL
jgi:hypothetical protein